MKTSHPGLRRTGLIACMAAAATATLHLPGPESADEGTESIASEATHISDPVAWQRAARRHLAREAKRPFRQDDHTWLRHERSGLQLAVDAEGVGTILPDGALPSEDQRGVRLRTSAIQQGDQRLDVAAAPPAQGPCVQGAGEDCIRRVDIAHGPVTTWWTHTTRGLEQGWTVAEPLGTGSLRIDVDTDGVEVGLVDGDLRLGDETSGLRGDAIVAWDADGHTLDVEVIATDRGFALDVDVDEATWPVTVDPTWSAWADTRPGPRAASGFGAAVAMDGDVNGDGYADALIAAPTLRASRGRVFLYLGGPSGLSVFPTQAWTGPRAHTRLGTGVAFLGDVNGDGHEDIGLGAPGLNGGGTDAGGLIVFLGSASGFGTTPDQIFLGQTSQQFYGGHVRKAGDVNGDGLGDVLVSSLTTPRSSKAIDLYLGTTTGLSSTPVRSWLVDNQPRRSLATVAQGVGDVNDDGFDDIVVGEPLYNQDSLYRVYHGGSGGPVGSPATRITTGPVGGGVGITDAQGDGVPDLVIGRSTGAQVHFGGPGGLLSSPDQVLTYPTSTPFVSAAGADFDGDGFGDLLVGYSEWVEDVRLLRGTAQGLTAEPHTTWRGMPAEVGFGMALSAGDTNGDDQPDALIGAPDIDTASDTGVNATRSYRRGNIFWLSTSASSFDVDRPSFYADIRSAKDNEVLFADIDGDGDDDMVALHRDELTWHIRTGDSLPDARDGRIDNPQNGSSSWDQGAAVPCDVDADGFEDVVVAAPLYDVPGGTNNGALLVFHGGPSGLVGPTEYDTSDTDDFDEVHCVGDVDDDGYPDLVTGSGSSAREHRIWLGGPTLTMTDALDNTAGSTSRNARATGGGDLNGDGYPDVVISAPRSNTLLAWLGGPGGPQIAPDVSWTSPAGGPGRVGAAIDFAGDMNGDGFDDLIATSPGTTPSRGRGFVHLVLGDSGGFAAGVARSWAAPEVETSFVHGPAVGLGDVNGDGFADAAILSSADDPEIPPDSYLRVIFGAETPGDFGLGWAAGSHHRPPTLRKLGDWDNDGFDDFGSWMANPTSSRDNMGVFIWRGSPDGPQLLVTP